MSIAWLLTGYCLLVALASVAGGWLPSLLRMTHLRTQLLMSFVSGLMLGIATLHLLPHAMESLGSTSRTGAAMLVGVIGMFLLLRAFHVHHHGELPTAMAPLATDPGAVEPGALEQGAVEPDAMRPGDGRRGCDHGASACGHEHGPSHPAAGDDARPRRIGWIGMVFGLGLHTVMDGVALGASVAADAAHGAWLGLAGLGTFLAVALHKPLDAFSISSVMASGGWSLAQRSAVNLAFGLCCPIGAGLFYFGATRLEIGGGILGYGLALSAGFFICIALADLLPEVQFHHHDRVILTAALLLGIALAVGIENLPGHSHHHHDSHPRHDEGIRMTPAEAFRARIGGEAAHHGHSHDGHDHE